MALFRSPIVISLGRDFALLRKRSCLLASKGFSVLTVGDLHGALQLLAHDSRYVGGAIICHSFSPFERLSIEHTLRRVHPRLTVITLRSESDAEPLRFMVGASPQSGVRSCAAQAGAA